MINGGEKGKMKNSFGFEISTIDEVAA